MKITTVSYILMGLCLLSACDKKATNAESLNGTKLIDTLTKHVSISEDNLLAGHLKALNKAKDVEKQLKDALKKRMSIVD